MKDEEPALEDLTPAHHNADKRAHEDEEQMPPSSTEVPEQNNGTSFQTNKSHPRLARGESYPCGYKPYRCEVCGYSTTTKGNLTIHLQSDKHSNNVRVLQAAGKLPKRITVMPESQLHARTILPEASEEASRPWKCPPCGYSTAVASNLRIHLSSGKHQSAVAVRDSIFFCGICSKFMSDSLDGLEQHVNSWRQIDEDTALLQQDDNFVCTLCNYQTTLKSNFTIHCKTDKHLGRQQLAAHIREGGIQNEWRLRYLPQGLQLVCQLCQFTAASWDGLKLHAASEKHLNSVQLYQKVKELQIPPSCSTCGHVSKSKLEQVRHAMENKHSLKLPPSNSKNEGESQPAVSYQNGNNHSTLENDFPCPLCLEAIPGEKLELHLRHTHQVCPEVAQRLVFQQPPPTSQFNPYSKTGTNSLLPPSSLFQSSAAQNSLPCGQCFESFDNELQRQVHQMTAHPHPPQPSVQQLLQSLKPPLPVASQLQLDWAQRLSANAGAQTGMNPILAQLLLNQFQTSSSSSEAVLAARTGENQPTEEDESRKSSMDQDGNSADQLGFISDEENQNPLQIVEEDESATVKCENLAENSSFQSAGNSISEHENSKEESGNRRMRTLISPEQAEILYQEYLKDNCPPRHRLEDIAQSTGLKRRVVQVWFQNTRARERKGQYRSVSHFAGSKKPSSAPISSNSLLSLATFTDRTQNNEIEIAVSESGSKSYPASPEDGFGLSSLDDDSALPTMLKMSAKKTFANNNYVKTPSPGSLVTGRLSADGSESGQKRSRTQLSQGQVFAMQSTFEMYRSPSLAECEILGNGIGLARRVVQVWFQNHRAKERRNRAARGETPEPPSPEPPKICSICHVPIAGHTELREHLFSAAHINQLKVTHGINTHASQSPPSPQTVEPAENANASLFGKLLGGQSSSSSQAMANFTIFANIQRIMASRAGLSPLESATVCEINEENV
uniref:ATBF n=1 Tax=Oikopleura dioica TaxID=34765 RepID=Q5EVF4_OIKDI|nr:ATBF [Oikopleura dioica]